MRGSTGPTRRRLVDAATAPAAARRRPTLPTDQQGRVQVRDVPLGALRPVLRGRFADAVAVRGRPVLGGAALGHSSAVVDPHFQGDIQSRPVAAFTGHPFWKFEGAAQFGQP